MATFTEADARAMLAFVHDLASAADVDSLRRNAARELRRLIPSDSVTLVEIDAAARVIRGALDPPDAEPSSDLNSAYWEHRGDNPVVRHRRATRDPDALKMTDFVTQRQFRRLPLYASFFRHVGVEYQLSASLGEPNPKVLTVGCNRSSRDFSERDRAALRLLRSHLAAAYEAVETRARFLSVPAEEEGRPPDDFGLTTREREILAWVARGKTNPQIARALFLSPRTVQKHLEHVFKKLGVATRTEAAATALAARSFTSGEPRSAGRH